MKTSRVLVWLFAGLLSSWSSAGAASQRPAQDVKEWKIQFNVVGGIAGYDRHLTLTNDGQFIAEDRRLKQRVTGRAPDALVAKVSAFLKAAREVKKPGEPSRPMPDALLLSLDVDAGGRQYRVVMSNEIAMDLQAALDSALRTDRR